MNLPFPNGFPTPLGGFFGDFTQNFLRRSFWPDSSLGKPLIFFLNRLAFGDLFRRPAAFGHKQNAPIFFGKTSDLYNINSLQATLLIV